LGLLLVRDGIALGREATTSLGRDGAAKELVASIGRVTGRVGVTTEQLAAHLQQASQNAAARIATLAEGVASATASSLLAFFFAILTMYFVLTREETIMAVAQQALPLRPEYTRKLLGDLREVGRKTLVGTVGSGVAQGVLATLGYWMAGLPSPVFFGAATAVLSLVPGVGAMLVWGPAAAALILLGHVGRGIFLLAWGLVIVGALNDYVIRPRLIGNHGGLPPLATFVALFGGAATMGLKGLIVGPVIVSLAFAVLKLYVEEARQRRASPLA